MSYDVAVNRFRATLLATAALALGGCATSVFNPATNKPLARGTPVMMGAPQDIVSENAIALSFSGGGLRAAAFAHGVLKALQETKTSTGDLTDDVVFISSVSGGSLTAAHFGLHGREGFDRFRSEVLLRDFESDMRLSVANPANLVRIFGGGLNARENFGDALDEHVFKRATFADLYKRGKPDIRIHATDLYNRVAFPFVPRLFGILCSDIRSYSVADAVTASMAVPLVFAPIVVRTYPDHCNEPLPWIIDDIRGEADSSRTLKAVERAFTSYRDPKPKYLRLVDGGVTDNFGLSTIAVSRAILSTPYAPLTLADAVRIRRMLFIVVDASRGPTGDWIHQEQAISGVDLALQATDAATDTSARLAADGFGDLLREWQSELVRFRCGLAREEVTRLGGPVQGWNCSDVRFYLAFLTIDRLAPDDRARLEAIPTRLTLPADQVDAAIEGGRRGTLALPRLGQYLRDRIR